MSKEREKTMKEEREKRKRKEKVIGRKERN